MLLDNISLVYDSQCTSVVAILPNGGALKRWETKSIFSLSDVRGQ